MTRSLLSVILLAILIPPGSSAQKNLSPALASLVSAEREFASSSLRDGIRASFMRYFADDGVVLSPRPHLYKEWALKAPPPARPRDRTLYWEPILADVSSSADLGYTMGPFSLKDSTKPEEPPSYGFFFSIWQMQPDGAWKVAVDVGTGSTTVVEKYFGKQVAAAPHAIFKSRGIAGGGKAASRELIDMDKTFSQSVTKGGVRAAYQKALDAHACAMREGLVPITGKDAVLAYLVNGTALRSLEPMRGDVSAAGDMGYTYGAYRQKKNSNDPSGYYVRVWRKDAKRKWVIAVELAAPAK